MSRDLLCSHSPHQGYSDIASVFRSTAEGETGHAHGHLEFLQEVLLPAISVFMLCVCVRVRVLCCCIDLVMCDALRVQVGDPVTDMPMGDTEANLLSAIGHHL